MLYSIVYYIMSLYIYIYIYIIVYYIIWTFPLARADGPHTPIAVRIVCRKSWSSFVPKISRGQNKLLLLTTGNRSEQGVALQTSDSRRSRLRDPGAGSWIIDSGGSEIRDPLFALQYPTRSPLFAGSEIRALALFRRRLNGYPA